MSDVRRFAVELPAWSTVRCQPLSESPSIGQESTPALRRAQGALEQGRTPKGGLFRRFMYSPSYSAERRFKGRCFTIGALQKALRRRGAQPERVYGTR